MDQRKRVLLDEMFFRSSIGDDIPPNLGGTFSDSATPFGNSSKIGDNVKNLSMSLMPGVGDVVGPAQDIGEFISNPESRNVTNYALAGLGVLPFVPSLGGVTRTVKGWGKIGGQKDAAYSLAEYAKSKGVTANVVSGGKNPAGQSYYVYLQDVPGKSPTQIRVSDHYIGGKRHNLNEYLAHALNDDDVFLAKNKIDKYISGGIEEENKISHIINNFSKEDLEKYKKVLAKNEYKRFPPQKAEAERVASRNEILKKYNIDSSDSHDVRIFELALSKMLRKPKY